MSNSEFHIETRKYLKKLFRIRKRLIKARKSLNPMASVELNWLERHIEVNGYWSNSSMAGFIMRNRHRILTIIPKSRNYETLKNELIKLLDRSELLTNN